MAKKILVLFGGVSTEYLISLRSAYNIISGLRQAGFHVIRWVSHPPVNGIVLTVRMKIF